MGNFDRAMLEYVLAHPKGNLDILEELWQRLRRHARNEGVNNAVMNRQIETIVRAQQNGYDVSKFFIAIPDGPE